MDRLKFRATSLTSTMAIVVGILLGLLILYQGHIISLLKIALNRG